MRLLRTSGILTACALLAACAGMAPSEQSAQGRTGVVERGTEIRLPSGLVCQWMPDVSPEGPYDCGVSEEGEVRLAAPPLVTGRTLRATVRILAAGMPVRWEALVAEIEEVVLADGTICRGAGDDGTAASDEGRLAFACAAADFDGLAGVRQMGGGWFAGEAVRLERSTAGIAPRAGRVAVATISLRASGPGGDPLPNPVGGGLVSSRF